MVLFHRYYKGQQFHFRNLLCDILSFFLKGYHLSAKHVGTFHEIYNYTMSVYLNMKYKDVVKNGNE